MNLTYSTIKDYYNRNHYPFFTGKYNINLFGIRAKNNKVDEFNDILGVAYQDFFGNEMVLAWQGTTDPGSYYLKNKMGNMDGTFILMPGFYRGVWKLGLHKGYPALVQAKSGIFKGWRDNDKDGELDTNGTVFSNVQGLNSHAASFKNILDNVGPYSAGCQVNRYGEEHKIKVSIATISSNFYGNSFSYALFEE